uniref:Uncharacterized protein n=1 Tax=Hemiselmis tepida TaxID=464990 RepID=A0A7S0VBY2_9CRYP|mmetsp:Transcript_14389/g.36768  ORF Transcript_14389/g.36768 Transcript_14389/m.36768 type:complete len:163 (+) Transcript_14389:30-518(+)
MQLALFVAGVVCLAHATAFTSPVQCLSQSRTITSSAARAVRRAPLALSMQEGEDENLKKKWFSRNVPTDIKRSRKYFEIEERGEFLAGPDRQDEWGEELTEIGKWQRTKGPIYVQSGGGGLLAFGFFNYFALGNMYGASSAMFSLGILVGLLGFALQRSTSS